MCRIRCPQCGKSGQVPVGYVGQRVRCKSCGQSFMASQQQERDATVLSSRTQDPVASPDASEPRKDEPVIAPSLRCGRCAEEFGSPVEVSFKCPKCDAPLAGYARGLIGRPGEVWINNTDRILYQFVPTFDLSCGVCVQYASKISLWWSMLHQGCNCRSHPIYPGQTSLPFIDFREVIERLDSTQQHASTGKCNWILLNAGIVAWEDVITSCRVREFHEVMDRGRLSLETMIQAGVPEDEARKAWELVYTPERLKADSKRREAFQALRELGLSTDDITKAVAQKLSERVTATGSPAKKRKH